ncbi:hypothetical protein, partial [Lactiplantibacillus pingfangensis]|uniref:hypothetical protein n=1 Tax=Lactiplantibacillus pingfangensis TaxID=2559915 RepID=UPI001CC6B411
SKLNLLINETPKIGFFCPTLGVHFKVASFFNEHLILGDYPCHSGWSETGWNVVATFGSQSAVFQAGLFLSRKITD